MPPSATRVEHNVRHHMLGQVPFDVLRAVWACSDDFTTIPADHSGDVMLQRVRSGSFLATQST
jgi:hypothetical protein